jgi:hypothetical protein
VTTDHFVSIKPSELNAINPKPILKKPSESNLKLAEIHSAKKLPESPKPPTATTT